MCYLVNFSIRSNVSFVICFQVNKIRDQCHKQEETINEQEGELNAKRSELQKLKDEESALQKEYDDNNNELSKLTKHLQNTQLQISSVNMPGFILYCKYVYSYIFLLFNRFVPWLPS